MANYYEIKFFQPARDMFGSKKNQLDSVFSHPYRGDYASVVDFGRQDQYYTGAKMLQYPGGQGSFLFVDGVCEKWLGEYRAEIVRSADKSEHLKPDRYEPA